MKKILIIIPSIKKWGWAETVATTIWNKLYDEWYKIMYLTFYNEKKEIEFKWEYKSLDEDITNNIFINFLKLFKRAKEISRYSKANDINITISHLDEANFSNILSKIFFWNKSKIIIEIHNSIEKSLSNIYLLIYKLIIKYSDKIISLTKEDLINYNKYFKINSKKIINIYNPIDLSKIKQLNKKIITEQDIKNNIFTFINIWRLNNQKNQILLIEAFLQFNLKFKDSRLLILWEWPLEKQLKNKARNNKNIIFLWRKDNPYSYLKKSDYLIMSSDYEWLPVVQIEALACNTPIISSNCKTWPKEIINLTNNSFNRENKIEIWDCWILYPNWDLNKLIKSMEIAYNNENNIKNIFIKKSKEKVKDFELINIIKLWKKIIEE